MLKTDKGVKLQKKKNQLLSEEFYNNQLLRIIEHQNHDWVDDNNPDPLQDLHRL